MSQHRSVKGHWRRAQARKGQGRIHDAIKGTAAVCLISRNLIAPIDLQAVLKLQPSNAEALVELSSLIQPRRNSKSLSSPFAAHTPSPSTAGSSSYKSEESTTSDESSESSDKSLPFGRTYRDDFKLKITSLPLTIDVPVGLPPPFVDSHERAKLPIPPSPTSVPTRLKTFSYPSWERYVVQKAT